MNIHVQIIFYYTIFHSYITSIEIPFEERLFECHFQLQQHETNITKYFQLSLIKNYTYATYTFYKVSSSKHSYVHENGTFPTSNVKYQFVTDHYTSPTSSNTTNTFTLPFYLITRNGTGLDVFTLPYTQTPQERKSNLVYSLYEQHITQHLSFGIYLHNIEQGYIYFDAHSLISTAYHGYRVRKCKITHHKYWGCDLNRIKIGEHVYDNEAPMFFDASGKGILAPKKFIEWIEREKVFEQMLKNWSCYFVERVFSMMECDCGVVEALPRFTFWFGEEEIEVDTRYLFRKANSQCRLKISENHNKNGDEWVFDFSLFRQYLGVFSYEENAILFYDRNEKYKGDKVSLYKGMLIGVIVLSEVPLICLYVVMLLRQYKYK